MRMKIVAAALLFVVLLGPSNVATAAQIIYVSKSGDDSHSGTSPKNAVKTVTRGLALATQAGSEVKVAIGVYEENLLIERPIVLSGGWSDAFEESQRTLFKPGDIVNATPGTDCKSRTCFIAAAGSEQTLAIRYTPQFNGVATLSQLVIFGPDLSGRADGSSSYALVVQRAPAIDLEFVILQAGKGATGNEGPFGSGGMGYCTQGGAGGETTGGEHFTGRGNEISCSATDGRDGTTAAGHIEYGKGGKSPFSDCGSMSRQTTPLSAVNGGDGHDGTNGSGGSASPFAAGTFVDDGRLHWVAASISVLARGGPGIAGASGGGGSAGGSAPASCGFLGWTKYAALGGKGGRGGSGGCPGTGGYGGGPGGGSFGLVINGATVTARNVALLGGASGAGGKGGNGGAGNSGEAGVDGNNGTVSKNECRGSATGAKGGHGGSGGRGGGGGGGAGGNGGPSLLIVTLKQGKYVGNVGVQKKQSGVAGPGGAGGTDSHGTSAPAGTAGRSSELVELP